MINNTETLLNKLYESFVAFIYSISPWLLVIYALVIIVAYYFIRVAGVLIINKFLTFKEVVLTSPHSDSKKILIVGDSTAVGTGAKRKEETIAGRFAKDFPHSDIHNLATNGSLTHAVLKQLKKAEDTIFDLIIISTGGNDVWNFRSLRKLSRELVEVLEAANAMSNHRVILLFFGNEGSAPFFPFFMRWFLLRRTKAVRDVFAEVATREKVPLIELFAENGDNPFIKDPKRFFAIDHLHPSGEGYRMWYERMWRVMVENGYLYDELLNSHTSRFSGDIHN